MLLTGDSKHDLSSSSLNISRLDEGERKRKENGRRPVILFVGLFSCVDEEVRRCAGGEEGSVAETCDR